MIMYLAASFIWWQILAITVVSSGYHRYFAHKSFSAPIWYEWYVLALGTLTGSGPLIGWVGVHRIHHKHSDTKRDPHSPLYQSLWRVLTSTFKVPHIERRCIRDLLHNPRVLFFYRNHARIRIGQFIIAVLIAIIFSWQWTIVIFLSPMILSYIGFGMINAFGHGPNGARNSHLLNILAGGDGFHKNHHDRPGDWQIGKKWYEFDPGALFIRLIRTE